MQEYLEKMRSIDGMKLAELVVSGGIAKFEFDETAAEIMGRSEFEKTLVAACLLQIEKIVFACAVEDTQRMSVDEALEAANEYLDNAVGMLKNNIRERV